MAAKSTASKGTAPLSSGRDDRRIQVLRRRAVERLARVRSALVMGVVAAGVVTPLIVLGIGWVIFAFPEIPRVLAWTASMAAGAWLGFLTATGMSLYLVGWCLKEMTGDEQKA